jgi:hypothetical protein
MDSGTGMRPSKNIAAILQVLLEHDLGHVLEYRLELGEKEAIHSHQAEVVYVPPCRQT